ncbi:MAG: insulinase family protein [Proteobacteria bacterium]|nr:insulinase family protein [Pseudomonadota bacterium]
MLKSSAVLLALFVIAGCTSTPATYDSTSPATSKQSVEIYKSPNDHRAYRYLVLRNEMRVLLISDPETDKAAASLVVQRGQYHDPDEYLGLAHFLEHMLFIGTKKYPEVDGYQTFITRHGGSSNAYTAADHTNYFFDIQPDQFAAGLDRFSQFFISPLFDEQYVEREKNAVHSEYQLQVKDDGWRGNAAARGVINPEHPASKFHIGSLESLGEGLRDALLDFFEKNYSADQMILVALTNESLDEMESWITPMFSVIENRRVGPAEKTAALFTASDLPAILHYQTLKETRRVVYNFPVPSTTPHFRAKPAGYLTNLIGHEGAGSLHRYLQEKGYIESLSAGDGRFDDDTSLINIDISLTPHGAENIAAVTDALFSYIELLKANPPENWRYAEQATVAEMAFRFQEPPSPMRMVYSLGPNLALFPPQDVLRAGYLMEAFESGLINEYLAALTPQNLFMEIVGNDVETDSIEKWFQVPYRIERRAPVVEPTQTVSFSLPEKNLFLPENLDLLADTSTPPQVVEEDPTHVIWLKTDTEFGAPRSNMFVTLSLPRGIETVQELVAANLFQKFLTDDLNVLTYPAFLAGLGYQVVVVPSGLRLVTNGYNDKQNILLTEVLKAFQAVDPDQIRFDRFSAELIREWQNFTNERPYTQTNTALSNLVMSNAYSPPVLAQALTNLTLADLRRFQEERLRSLSVTALMHGNVNRSDVDDLIATLETHLDLKAIPQIKPLVETMDGNYRFEVPIDHTDASIILYVQDNEASINARAQSMLAVQLIRSAFFTSLRTNQQLGYVVAATHRTYRDQGGIAFIIQSPVASPLALEAATKTFAQGQIAAIEAMSAADFEGARQGLISQLTEKEKNLDSRTQRLWNEIDQNAVNFDTREQTAGAVGNLTQADMVAFIKTLVHKLNTQRLIVYNMGKFEDAPEAGDPIESVEAFKQR